MEEKQLQATTGRRSAAQQLRRRSRSVFQYIAVLFAAAFLLLLYTFLMERRQNQLIQAENQEQIATLQKSASTVQSLQGLMDQNQSLQEENAALKEQADRLEKELAQAQSQLDALPDAISQQEHVLEQTKQAMDWFWQIDEAYVRGRRKLCRELISHMEESSGGQTPLKDYLPTESATANGRFSPRDRYQEIYDALF